MKRYICGLAMLIILASCGGNGQKKVNKKKETINSEVAAGNTPNQQEGIKMITGFYGGICKATSGTEGENENTRRFIKLEVSKSAPLDSSMNITALNAGNIALMFYSTLGEEAANFDEVISVILFADGQSVEKKYSIATLSMIMRKTQTVVKIVDALKDKRYERLDTLLNDKNGIVNYKKDLLIEKIRKTDPPIGNIKSFIPYGFLFFKSDNNKDVLHISGMIFRDNKNNEFSVDIDTNARRDEALFINYKF